MVHILYTIGGLIQIIVVMVWLWQHLLINRIHRQGWRAPSCPKKLDVPPITVIVPVRNEGHQIQDCLATIVHQDISALQLIVVDDRSTDDTLTKLHEFNHANISYRIIRIETLPPDWLGKSHALWTAARQAQGEWLLFLDADCRLKPQAIRSVMSYARQRHLDMLSLWPEDGSRTFWAHLLIPLCGAQIVIWYGNDRVNDPKHTSAFANGQFILIHRDAYLRIGGHSQVKQAIIEDVPLARHAKNSGLRTLTALGNDIYSVCMYDSLRDITSGWTRIYRGVLSCWQISGCLIWLILGSALPFIMIPLTLLFSSPPTFWEIFWLVAPWVHLFVLTSVSLRFFALSHCKLIYLLLYPLSILGVFFILTRSLLQTILQSSVTWKETTYRVSGTNITPPY